MTAKRSARPVIRRQRFFARTKGSRKTASGREDVPACASSGPLRLPLAASAHVRALRVAQIACRRVAGSDMVQAPIAHHAFAVQAPWPVKQPRYHHLEFAESAVTRLDASRLGVLQHPLSCLVSSATIGSPDHAVTSSPGSASYSKGRTPCPARFFPVMFSSTKSPPNGFTHWVIFLSHSSLCPRVPFLPDYGLVRGVNRKPQPRPVKCAMIPDMFIRLTIIV